MSVEFIRAEHAGFDVDTVAALERRIRPDDYRSAADLRDWSETQQRAGRLAVRWLARVDDAIVGFSRVDQSPWLRPTMADTDVMVHPDHRRKGIGRTLLERVEAEAARHGVIAAIGWASETATGSHAFLTRAGYRENDREWLSILHLDRIDESVLKQALERVGEERIRIVSLDTLSRHRRGWQQDVHRLYVEVESDVPTRYRLEAITFEDFDAFVLGRRLLAGGFHVAVDGDRLVGLTEPLRVEDDPTVLDQELTGVKSGYRGRGVATALKAAAILWTKRAGYGKIRTANAQSNTSMLAVNERLGFERVRARIEYLKDL